METERDNYRQKFREADIERSRANKSEKQIVKEVGPKT